MKPTAKADSEIATIPSGPPENWRPILMDSSVVEIKTILFESWRRIISPNFNSKAVNTFTPGWLFNSSYKVPSYLQIYAWSL